VSWQRTSGATKNSRSISIEIADPTGHPDEVIFQTRVSDDIEG